MSIETFDWQGYMSDIGYAPEQIPNEINDEDREWLYGLWARDLMEQLNYEAKQNPFLATAEEKRNDARDKFLQYAPDLAYMFNTRGELNEADPDKTFDPEEFRQHVINNRVQNADLGYYLDTFAASRINPDTKYVRPWLEGMTKDQFKRSFMTQQDIDEAWTSVDAIREGNFGTLAAAYQAQQAQEALPKSGHMAALKKGWYEFEKLFGYTAGTLGDATGIQWLSDIGNEIAQNVIQKSDAYNYQSKYNQSLADTIKNEGVMAAGGKILNMAEENWATTAAPLALAAIGKILSTYAHVPQPLADAATRAVAANVVRRQGANLLRRASQLAYGSSMALSGLEIGGVRAELEEKGKYDPDNVADVVAAGLVSSSLDFIGNVAAMKGLTITAGRLWRSNLATMEARARLAKEIAEDQAKSFTRRVLSAMATEGVTEGLQEIPAMVVGARRGIEYTPKEVRDRIIDAAAVGAFMGGGIRTGEIMLEKYHRGDTEDTPTPTDTDTDEASETPDVPETPQGTPESQPEGIDGEVSSITDYRETRDGYAAFDGFDVGYGATRKEAAENLIKEANKGRVNIDENDIRSVTFGTENWSVVRYGDRNQNVLRVKGQDHDQYIRDIIRLHNDDKNTVNLRGSNTFDTANLSRDTLRETLAAAKVKVTPEMNIAAVRENTIDIPVNFSARPRENGPGSYAAFNLDDVTRDDLKSKGFRVLRNPRSENNGRDQRMVLYRNGVIYNVSLSNGETDQSVTARVTAKTLYQAYDDTRKGNKKKDKRKSNLRFDGEIATQNLRIRRENLDGSFTVVPGKTFNFDSVTVTPVIRPEALEIQRKTDTEGNRIFSLDPRQVLKKRIESLGGKVDIVDERGITYTTPSEGVTRLDLSADGRVLVSRDGKYIGDYVFDGTDIGEGVERAIFQQTQIEASELYRIVDIPESTRFEGNVLFVYLGDGNTPKGLREYYAIKGDGSVAYLGKGDDTFVERLLALPYIQNLDGARRVFADQFIEFYALPKFYEETGQFIGFETDDNLLPVLNLEDEGLRHFSNVEVDELISAGYNRDFVKVYAIIAPNGEIVRATTQEGIDTFIEDIKDYANILDRSEWERPTDSVIFPGELGRYRADDLYTVMYDDNLFDNLFTDNDFEEDTKKIQDATGRIIFDMKRTIYALERIGTIDRARIDSIKTLIDNIGTEPFTFPELDQLTSPIYDARTSYPSERLNVIARRRFYRMRTAQAMLLIDMYRNKLQGFVNNEELAKITDRISDYNITLTTDEVRRNTIQAESLAVRLEEAYVDFMRSSQPTQTTDVFWEAIYPSSTGYNYGSFVNRIHSEGTDFRFSRAAETPRVRRKDSILNELQKELGDFTLNEMLEKGLRGESGGLVILPDQEAAHNIERMFTTDATQPYYGDEGLIQGFVAPDGMIYLVEDGIVDGKARQIILHEYGVHARKFGMTDAQFQEVVQNIKAKRDEKSLEGDFVRHAITRAKQANKNMSEDNPIFWEEVAAYAVEDGYHLADTGIVGRMQTWMKNWLWRFGVIDATAFHYQDFVNMAQGMLGNPGPLSFFDGTHDYTKYQDSWKNIPKFSRTILAEDTPEREEFAQRTYRRLRGLDDAIDRERNGESADAIEQATDWRRNDNGNWGIRYSRISEESNISEEVNRQYEEVRNKYFGTDEWLKIRDKVTGELVNSNLDERQWIHVRTQFFKNWFGDWENNPQSASKVVDEHGEPLVVYHGSPVEDLVSLVNRSEIEGNERGFRGTGDAGIYFSPKRSYAERYTSSDLTKEESGGRVYEMFLNIRNPATLRESGLTTIDKISREEAQRIQDSGYDGIMYEHRKRPEYVIFNSLQVRSATENVGTYGATGSAEFRYSRATVEDLKPYKSFINDLEDNLVRERISGVPREGDTVLYQRGDVNEFITRDSLYTIEDADDYYPDLEQRWIDYHRDDSESNFVRYSRSIPETNGFRYSFISEDAARRLDEASGVTTRIDEWRIANQMEANGATEDEIKLATNWSRGRDGIWRYEVSDRWMQVSIPVLRDRRLILKKLKEKFSETYKRVSDEDGWREYYKAKDDLINFYVNITKHDDPNKITVLSNIIVHRELFQAYPQLQLIEFRFVDDRKENSVGSVIDNSILEVNIGRIIKYRSSVKKIEDDIRSTIIHEVQHLIQNFSGFAKGGNPEMFETMSEIERKKNVASAYDASVDGIKEFKRIFLNEKNFNSFLKSNPQLTEGEIENLRRTLFDKFPRYSYPTDLREFVGDSFYKFLKKKVSYKKIPIDDYWKDLTESFKGMKILQHFYSRNSHWKYRRLLGEIEARLAERRRSLTEEQLRNTPISLSEREEDILSTRDMVDPVSLLPLDYIRLSGNVQTPFNFRYSRTATIDDVPQTARQRGTQVSNAPGMYKMPDGSLHIEPSELPVGFESETILYAAIAVSDPAKEEPKIAELRGLILTDPDLMRETDRMMRERNDTNEDHRLGYAVSLILEAYDPTSDIYQQTVDAFHEAVSKATGGAYQNLILDTGQIEAAAHAAAGIPYEALLTAPQETVPTPRPDTGDVQRQQLEEAFANSDAQREYMQVGEDGRPFIATDDSDVDVVFESKVTNPFTTGELADKVLVETTEHTESDDFYNHLADSPHHGTQEPLDTGNFTAQADTMRNEVEAFLASVLPEHIWNRMQILWEDNAENRKLLGNALGNFNIKAWQNKNILVRGWDRSFGQVVRTAAREASRFGWGLWQNRDFRKALTDFYDMYTARIHEELRPYYNQMGVTDPTKLTNGQKIFMVQTFFSKLNQSLFTDDATNMADILGIDAQEYKRVLANVRRGISAQENDLSPFMQGVAGDPELAKQFAREMLRMTMETATNVGTHFVYERANTLGGKDRIHVYTNEWGTWRNTESKTRFGEVAQQIKENLEWWRNRYKGSPKIEKFARWMMRNAPVWMKYPFKWMHLYVPSARLGDTTLGKASQMISRVWQRIGDMSGTTIQQDYALMEDIHGILRDHGYDPLVADDMFDQTGRRITYEQFFRGLGITSAKAMEKARLADEVVRTAEQLRKEQAANIRSVIVETGVSLYNRMVNAGVPQRNIEAMVNDFERKRQRYHDNYSHRMYEAFTPEGKSELSRMLHYLKRDPATGELTIAKRARQAEEKIRQAEARYGRGTSQFYKETVEARKDLRRYERLTHLQNFVKAVVRDKKRLFGAEFNEAVVAEMKNTINAIVLDAQSIGRVDTQAVPHYNSIAAQKARKLDPSKAHHRELMAFLSEIKDPMRIAVYSADQQRQIIAKLQFNKELGEYLVDNNMASVRGVPNTESIARDLAQMESGTFLEYINVDPEFMPEIKAEWENMQKVTETVLGGLTDAVKANSTVYSLRLAMNNYIGNASMLLASGHFWRFGNWMEAGGIVRKQFLDRFTYGAKDPSDFGKMIIKEMEDAMVTGGSGTEMSVFQLNKGAHENFVQMMTELLYGKNLITRAGKFKVDNFVKRSLEYARKFYTYGDEWVKPLMYINNRMNAIAKYEAIEKRQNGETEEEYKERVLKKAIEEASEMTIRETVSWENSPFFVRQLSTKSTRFFVPDFLLHNFQMLRITASNYVRLMELGKELANFNPTEMNPDKVEEYRSALKKEFAQRSVGGAMTAGVYAGLAGATGSCMAFIPYMMNTLMAAIDGEDDKDKDNTFFNPQQWEGAQRILNYKTGGDNFFVPAWMHGGKIYAWNYGRASVMLTHAIPQPATENPEFTDYAAQFFKNIVNIGGGTIAQEIVNNFQGKDKWGREIGMEAGWGRIVDRVLIPGAVRQILDMSIGYPGSSDNPYREGKAIKMSDAVGITVNAYDMRDIVNELGWDMGRVGSNAQNVVRKSFVKRLTQSDALSDSDVASMVSDMREDNAKQLDRANYLLTGLRQMGMENKDIQHWLTTSRKDAGTILSKKQATAFLKGHNVYDDALVTYLKNRRNNLAKGKDDVRMSGEELAVVLQNYDKAIRIYSQALRAH